MVGAMVLAIMGQRGPGSLLSGVEGPAPIEDAAPAETEPAEESSETPQ